MAGSVNKVILVGNLGKDPEVRNAQDGTRIVNFTLATSETWNDRASGERRERTEWHRVVIFNDRVGEIAERYLRKGSKVYVEGSLQTRKWTDQSGQERFTTEVVIGRFNGQMTLLDSRASAGSEGPSYGGGGGEMAGAGGGGGQPMRERAPAAAGAGGGRPGAGRGGPSWDAPKGGDLDDEIPF